MIDESAKTFDFTVSERSLAGEAKRVYYMLRRAAILAGDQDALPEGKVYTEAQVIEILGEDYAAGLAIHKKCCG